MTHRTSPVPPPAVNSPRTRHPLVLTATSDPQALREVSKPVEAFAKRHRTPLSLLSTTNLACIVWQTLSGARNLLFEQRASMIVSVIVLSATVHVFYLAINHVAIKWVRGEGTGLVPPIRDTGQSNRAKALR